MESSKQYADLTLKQVHGITRSIVLGLRLQQEHPEIADWYQMGYTRKAIAEALIEDGFSEKSTTILESAVSRAIRGSKDSFEDVPSYEGLLSEGECDYLANEHITEAAIRSYQNKTGIHGRTPEQMRADARKGNIKQGFTPWEEDEVLLAYALQGNPNLTYKDVARILNDNKHEKEEIRTGQGVEHRLRRYRKSLEQKLN